MLHTPLPVVVRYRPLILITGFLGAGKTTFMRKLLESLKSHRIEADVILNDYENADLDAETIRDSAATLTPLAAACACCNGLDELISVAMAAQQTRSPVLIVEINGTADPTPLAETFTLLEKKIRLRPRWQVAVIDARRFGRRGDYDELEILQFQTASHWLASHRDEVSAEQFTDLKARLKKLNPQATEITAARLSTQLSEVIAASRPALERDEDSPVCKTTRPRGHRLAHAFTGCQFLLPPVVSFDALHGFLIALPPSVIRVKSLVTLKDDPGRRWLFERIGADEIPAPLHVPISERVPPSVICIGPDLDPPALLDIARHHFGSSVTIPSDE